MVVGPAIPDWGVSAAESLLEVPGAQAMATAQGRAATRGRSGMQQRRLARTS